MRSLYGPPLPVDESPANEAPSQGQPLVYPLLNWPERFEREMGCTAREWVSALPRAVGDYPLVLTEKRGCDGLTGAGQPDSGRAVVTLAEGQLTLDWETLPPRRLGLAILPRLQVVFAFHAVPEALRRSFLQRFDLYTQRGGG